MQPDARPLSATLAPLALAFAAHAAFTLAPRAQTAQLVKDIHTGADAITAGSDPTPSRPAAQSAGDRYFTKNGPLVYFTATTAASGTELWRSLGTAAGTSIVADIFPGPGSASPSELTWVGTQLYFAADDGKTGSELWVLDQTGARLVKDICPGPGSSAPSGLCALGNKVLFGADDGKNGIELWISDGTAQGTVLVKDILAGAEASAPRNLTANSAGTFIVFAAATQTFNNFELWKSDGTAQGTTQLAEINAGATSNPSFFNAVGSKILFQANDGTSGNELWSTDGTSAGTTLVKDIRPGTGAGAALTNAIVLGNKLLFQGSDAATGTEPWISDGTAQGTLMLADVFQGTTGGAFLYPTLHNGKVYFASRSSAAGYEIWETDGTSAGTKLVVPAIATSAPQYLAFAGNTLYFGITGSSGGFEPWVSDLTASGTKLLKDINQTTATAGSTPRYFTESIPGTMLFGANDGISGFELWLSDGTPQGTILADLNQPATPPTLGSTASNIVDLFGQILLSANDGATGIELWTSDGTGPGTSLLRDIHASNSSAPAVFALLGDKVLFRANDGATGNELWQSDGTAQGTVLLKDINPGSATSNPSSLARIGSKVYFAANNGQNGIELWVTDGTAQGTTLFLDINTASATASSSPSEFTRLDATRFLFRANNGTNGAELWISDGTAQGTTLLKDINPGNATSNPTGLTAFAGKIYFSANDGSQAGIELWVSDGTAQGTVLLKDIYPGLNQNNAANSSQPTHFAVLGSKLYFVANDGVAGSEIWETDGTAQGTKLALDIDPVKGGGSASSSRAETKNDTGGPGYLTRVGSRYLWLAARRYPSGLEIWRTDGTVAGTQMVRDINPANASSSPSNLGESGTPSFCVSYGRVFFQADDGTHGTELWVGLNGATAQPIGQVCGTTTLSATDPVLGGTSQVSGSTTMASPIHVLLLGIAATKPAPLGNGCWSYVDLSVFLPLAVSTQQQWSAPMAIANNTALLGVSAALQTWTFPAATFPLGLELSNGVLMTVGY